MSACCCYAKSLLNRGSSLLTLTMPLTTRSKRPINCKTAPYSHIISAYTLRRATKGVGRTQPVNWKDAGEVLGHDELKGCLMPDGRNDFSVRPGACRLTWGRCGFLQGSART